MMEKINNIITKTCQLFQKFGIKSVSMDDIARECGISKKTLYESVKDKKDLIKKVLDFEYDKEANIPHTFDLSNQNAIEALFTVYKGAIDFFKDFNMSMEYDLKKYYPLLYEKNVKRRREHMLKKMSTNMELGRKDGYFRDDFNIDIISKLHIIKIEALLQTDIFNKDDYSIVDIFKELFTYHLMAVSTPLGIETFKKKVEELESLSN